MKDECAVTPIAEYIGLRPKMYSILKANNGEIQKSLGRSRMSVVEDHDMGGNSISFLEVDGFRYPIVDPEIVKGMSQLKVKDDDILLLAYPKSGTHWLWEITSMLLQGKAETIPHWKSKLMVELQSQEVIDEFPGSPRVLNTHVRVLHYFAPLIVEAGVRVCISQAVEFFSLIGADYGSWFDYVLEWEKDIEAQQDQHPIHIMYYEDMKQNPLIEIRKLAVFLGVHADDSLYSPVAEKCQVGDWQNWLTPEQNEIFDKVYQEKMKDSKFKDKIRFTLT
ncbi:sulfotransferase 1C4-like [Haliotis rubra]|uniref:sulfotransferase 1C4-like n=1 Tax=Haliotis rubra TaxID=36100 RepID=UPI001EE53086|nr:sulfotransferase 1C4-like [Haliotis rubra]